MDIVHKMRLHASVDQLCVDDINASNIHGMLQFAREDCFSIKKDLIDDCAEHVTRRIKHDSQNVRVKALKLASILAREGPEEMKLCLSKRVAKILGDIVVDNGENFGKKTFEHAKDTTECLFGNLTKTSGSAIGSESSNRGSDSAKIVGISGQHSQQHSQQASLTGLEVASGLLRTAGGTAMNVAEKIGAQVNEIAKEKEKHRTKVDETYEKSEMTGGSLADAMRGVGGGGGGGGRSGTTASGPWGKPEEEEEIAKVKPEIKAEQTTMTPTPLSSDPLADLLGMATNFSNSGSARQGEQQSDSEVKRRQKASEWVLKGTGPTRAMVQSPPPPSAMPTLIPLDGSEEQKRVDSLCGVAGVKLVPDEAELAQLFEHIDRKGLEASLIVRALLDKIAFGYDAELMDAQSGWKCAKKALGCVSKALSRRDSVLAHALKENENVKLTLRKTMEIKGVKDTVKKSAGEILKQLDEMDASFFGTTSETTTAPPPAPPPSSSFQSAGLDASLFMVDAASDTNDAFFSSMAGTTTAAATTTTARTNYDAPKAPMTGPGLQALAELDAQQQQQHNKDGTRQKQDVTKAFASLKW
ncbi:unnamed protein product [Bathycoccus prasinos]